MPRPSTCRQPRMDPPQPVTGRSGERRGHRPLEAGRASVANGSGRLSDRWPGKGGEGEKPVTCLPGAGQSAGAKGEEAGPGRVGGPRLPGSAAEVGLCGARQRPRRSPPGRTPPVRYPRAAGLARGRAGPKGAGFANALRDELSGSR